MEKKNSKAVVWVIVGILLIIGAYVIFAKKDDMTSDSSGNQPAGEVESKEDTSAGSQNSSSTGSSMNYTQAVAAYGDRRIQLDTDCQAHPNSVTYKNGTSIMIDNRSARSARVRHGGAFTISPYSFKIVKLTSDKLPATYLVDCGASQNVATVLVQK
jgi:hypothetical protein